MDFILASGSPRRLEIFNMLGISPRVITADVEEKTEETTTDKIVISLSRLKGERVAEEHPESVVVSADTIVYHEGKVLGKPKSAEEAYSMLESFSGKSHEVWTGYTIFYKGQIISKSVMTRVFFRALAKDEIDKYIASGECFDKAGAYGAQGSAAAFVEKIEGDFFNVVGFPACDFIKTLRDIKIV